MGVQTKTETELFKPDMLYTLEEIRDITKFGRSHVYNVLKKNKTPRKTIGNTGRNTQRFSGRDLNLVFRLYDVEL